MIINYNKDSFDGKHFAMELHVVFYKDEYESMEKATTKPDGLCVMAFFFEVQNKTNRSFDEFTILLNNITKPKMKASFENPLPLIDYVCIIIT